MTEDAKNFPYTKEQLIWLDALESGKYSQWYGFLCSYNEKLEIESFCCLGLATYLLDKNHPSLEKRHEDNNSAATNLDSKVMEAYKLRNQLGRHVSLANTTLASLNDSGFNFARIAAEIRSEPSAYFTNLEKRGK